MTPTPHFYNEFDPFAAQWLRNLMDAEEIPRGTVDERSIKDVKASDLAGFTQVHLFAGISGWPLALKLAGWPAYRPVWTGSAPCQPYSSAGKGKGDADERNLWPEMYRLIRECRPDCVFGEQVESAIGHGWLDGISADLEREGYAVGAIVLGAHSIGAPHIRQRLWWVAHSKIVRLQQRIDRDENGAEHSIESIGETQGVRFTHAADRRLAESTESRQARRENSGTSSGHAGSLGCGRFESERSLPIGGLAYSEPSNARDREPGEQRQSGSGRIGFTDDGVDGGVGDTAIRGLAVRGGASGNSGHASFAGKSSGVGFSDSGERRQRNGAIETGDHEANPWSDFTIIPCRDGKYRRVPRAQSEVLGLADGISHDLGRTGPQSNAQETPCLERFPLAPRSQGRVGRLKGYGNAINPYVAAEFIRVAMEWLDAREAIPA